MSSLDKLMDEFKRLISECKADGSEWFTLSIPDAELILSDYESRKPPKKKYVLAKNYREAREYMAENRLSPVHNIYITSADKLLGLVIIEEDLIRVPGWTNNPLYDGRFHEVLGKRLERGRIYKESGRK